MVVAQILGINPLSVAVANASPIIAKIVVIMIPMIKARTAIIIAFNHPTAKKCFISSRMTSASAISATVCQGTM